MLRASPWSAAFLRAAVVCAVMAVTGAGARAAAEEAQAPAATPTPASDEDRFAFHVQSTFIYQGHDSFASPYRGQNSLSPTASARETWDVTLYGGARLWPGAELWLNGEVDQGFGLSDTLGVAGFPSGEAYKVGAAEPYFRLQRAFVRQTFEFSDDAQPVEADLNQFAGWRAARHLVITAGKMSVGDIFDTNSVAHDPRGDFMNWTVIDAGTFDYAADSWGYTAGAAAELWWDDWTVRGGAYLLSNVPNSPLIDTRFDQFQLIGELEHRHVLAGRPGDVKVTGFLSRGRMGRLDDAVRLGEATGAPPDASLVRRYAGRPGVSVNLEQQLIADVSLFARAGWADGAYEAYEFTDVDRSVSGGLSVKGARWGRAHDTVGLAGVVNQASRDREAYLAAGGLGILVGDGRLPHPSSERILEAYYDAAVASWLHVALDFQEIDNPAFNTQRGPVSALAVRLHAQY